MNHGEAVFTEEAELELLPPLMIDGAVPADRPKSGLPADFIVDQEVCVIGREARLPVDAAGPVPSRPGSIEQ